MIGFGACHSACCGRIEINRANTYKMNIN